MSAELVPADLDIDVVIATRDRPARLAACLDALLRQTFKRFRVIVVDDSSSIPVAETLRSARRYEQPLLVLRNGSPMGPAASRNRGVAAGDARYLVFLDDDALPHPELLARHSAVLTRQPKAVSIGALLPPDGTRLQPWDLWQADRVAREHERLRRGDGIPCWAHLYTGNVAVSRSEFIAVGGFDPRFARQEDIDFGFRLSERGCQFVFEPGAVVWHESEHSLSEWLRIPSANARYDVLLDQLRPGSGRLRSVRQDLRRRHWLLRVARRVLRRAAVSRCAVRFASAAGRALCEIRTDRLAVLAFSLIWDLEYNRALAEATAHDAQGDPVS